MTSFETGDEYAQQRVKLRRNLNFDFDKASKQKVVRPQVGRVQKVKGKATMGLPVKKTKSSAKKRWLDKWSEGEEATQEDKENRPQPGTLRVNK